MYDNTNKNELNMTIGDSNQTNICVGLLIATLHYDFKLQSVVIDFGESQMGSIEFGCEENFGFDQIGQDYKLMKWIFYEYERTQTTWL